jgi:predicted Zn-dependent protease
VANEAQLATVLGHELTHVHERHLLEYTRSTRRKAVGLTIAGIAGSIVLAGVAGKKAQKGDWFDAYLINQVGNIMLQLGLTLGFLAAVNGFGRDLEREADSGALTLLDGAGYDLRQAPRVFELFLEDNGDRRKLETFFFGSHPNNRQRIANFEELLAGPFAAAATTDAGRITDTPEFHARTRVLVRDNARLNLESGRLGTAAADLRKVLQVTPNDAVAHFLLGEVHRLRAEGERDTAASTQATAAALESYEAAAGLDANYPDPWRAIGLIRYREGDRASALGAFRRYLDLAPPGDAERQRIRDFVVELEAAER